MFLKLSQNIVSTWKERWIRGHNFHEQGFVPLLTESKKQSFARYILGGVSLLRIPTP